MKKMLIIATILIITFFSAKSILAVKSSEALPEFKAVNTPLITREVALQKGSPILPDSKLLDVPLLNQMDKPLLYNGCEVTSLAMILNYNGVKVTKNELAENIKTVPLTYSN